MGLKKKSMAALKEKLLEDPHLWIAFAAATIFLLLEILHFLDLLPFEVAHGSGLAVVIMIMLMALVVDRLKESDQAHDNHELLQRLAHSTFDKKATLRRCPSAAEREEYEYLWAGYTDKYDVYNPSYQVDKDVGEREIADIFLSRYRDHRFKLARYIFLTGDEQGLQDLKTFCGLMNVVRHECQQAKDKLKVKICTDRKSASAAEMYLGTRDRIPTAVIELKDPALGFKHGKPYYYMIIHDADVIGPYLQKHFNEAWDDRKALDVDIFEEVPFALGERGDLAALKFDKWLLVFEKIRIAQVGTPIGTKGCFRYGQDSAPSFGGMKIKQAWRPDGYNVEVNNHKFALLDAGSKLVFDGREHVSNGASQTIIIAPNDNASTDGAH